MSTVELRRRAKRTIDRLSAEKLEAADRLLRQLSKEDAATVELLGIPGFMESLERGLADVAAGRMTPVDKLRRKR
jgi:hypothetical protein